MTTKKKPAKKPPQKKAVKSTPGKKVAAPKKKTAKKPANIDAAPAIAVSGTLQFFPLDNLHSWTGNVRTIGAEDNIDGLAASILAKGLLQPPVVFDAGGEMYVVAGKRRLLAIRQLNKQGAWPDSQPVPCMVIDNRGDLTESSLHENLVREPMHPLDMAEVFSNMLSIGGQTPEDIGARFNASATVVKKFAALHGLSKEVKAAYRAGRMNLAQAQAFTCVSDAKLQKSVWMMICDNMDNYSPPDIRQQLLADTLTMGHRLFKYIGEKAYTKAGGTITASLFDPEDDAVVNHPDILQKLAAEKLQKTADKVKAEGWNWVQISPVRGHDLTEGFKRFWPEKEPLDEAHQQEYDDLQIRLRDLNETDLEDQNEAWDKSVEEIDNRIAQLDDRKESFAGAVLENGGAIVSIGADGKETIERGWVRKEDQKNLTPKAEKKRNSMLSADGGETDGETQSEQPEERGLSKNLMLELTQQRQAAIAERLASNHDLGYKAISFALIMSFFAADIDPAGMPSCINIAVSRAPVETALTQPGMCVGFEKLNKLRQHWLDTMPDKGPDLWQWVLEQDGDIIDEILALIAAYALQDARVKEEGPQDRAPLAVDIQKRLGFDMADYYTARVDNFFSRAPKPVSILAIYEVAGAEAAATASKLKTDAARDCAETTLQDHVDKGGKKWLPAPLRNIGENS